MTTADERAEAARSWLSEAEEERGNDYGTRREFIAIGYVLLAIREDLGTLAYAHRPQEEQAYMRATVQAVGFPDSGVAG